MQSDFGLIQQDWEDTFLHSIYVSISSILPFDTHTSENSHQKYHLKISSYFSIKFARNDMQTVNFIRGIDLPQARYRTLITRFRFPFKFIGIWLYWQCPLDCEQNGILFGACRIRRKAFRIYFSFDRKIKIRICRKITFWILFNQTKFCINRKSVITIQIGFNLTYKFQK